jgi:hypothetical protein
LYDLRLDPHEVRNLADDPAHAGVKAELSAALSTWRVRVGDPGLIPEDQMIKAAWGAESQPQTVAPVITASQDAQGVSVMLASATEGASIGYRLAGEVRWRLYAGPFNAETGQRIEAKATRYGFKESDVSVRTAGD